MGSSNESNQQQNTGDQKPKRKRRAVVRLSRVDQRRLESGEIEDPYQAVGKPEPLSKLDDDDTGPEGNSESGRDNWLKQNVPPHW